MGWLTRWDHRNQRITDRQRKREAPVDNPDDDNAIVVGGLYASWFLPSIAGLVGGLIALLAAWRLRRKRTSD